MACDLTSSGADTVDKTSRADLEYHKLFKRSKKDHALHEERTSLWAWYATCSTLVHDMVAYPPAPNLFLI
jgi:hypothetical protein